MKREFTTYLAVLIFIILVSFRGNFEDKKYKVELTPNEWGSRFNWVQLAMIQLKKSNGPANEILPLCDSLKKFSDELLIQLQPQFAAQAKQDSINSKQKK